MDSLNFEWNENKNAFNLKKHGISFNEAKTVFADELGRLILDPDNSEGEEHFILMGSNISITPCISRSDDRSHNNCRVQT